DDASLLEQVLVPRSQVEMLLPVAIGDYTDFYASREHATNVGSMFRGPENALMPNWLHLPVAYHGRSSSVVISGTPIHRPNGQRRSGDGSPEFGPTTQLDFELEVGAIVGTGNALGTAIPVGRALDHVFGLVLVNDWSARDIQAWEYQPLGPFLGKNFATTISPWVVPLEALAPFRRSAPPPDPEPLPYLRDAAGSTFDLHLEVGLQPAETAEETAVCRSNHRHLYWTLAQQVAHHTVNGCNLRPGDLLASGTISGPEPESRGCLLELTWRGTQPLTLRSGGTRTFLADGDTVTMRGWAQGDGYRVGFGECTGQILGTGEARSSR
ncbi:MAG TPA: fumarylacetoacetase, partial [Rhodothermales bacterium]